MITEFLKSIFVSFAGWSPAILALLAEAISSTNFSFLEKSGGYVAAVIFFGLSKKYEASKKAAWESNERLRSQRDQIKEDLYEERIQRRLLEAELERLKSKP